MCKYSAVLPISLLHVGSVCADSQGDHRLDDGSSQMTAIFGLTAVKNSNPTYITCLSLSFVLFPLSISLFLFAVVVGVISRLSVCTGLPLTFHSAMINLTRKRTRDV